MDVNSEYKFLEVKNEGVDMNSIDLNHDVALANNSGVVAQKRTLETEKAELDVKIAKAGFLPTIAVTPEYRLDDDIKYGHKKDWGIGLEASMNIFQWGATLDDINQSKKALSRTSMRKENDLKELSTKIKAKYRDLQVTEKELRIAKNRAGILEENQKIQSIRFSNGMVSSLDYLEAVQLLREAEERTYTLQKQLILNHKEYQNLIK